MSWLPATAIVASLMHAFRLPCQCFQVGFTNTPKILKRQIRHAVVLDAILKLQLALKKWVPVAVGDAYITLAVTCRG
jgi:hypothetical protein